MRDAQIACCTGCANRLGSSAGAVGRSNHRLAREQLQGWQLNAVRRELQDDMRLAAGGVQLEDHDFQEGTAQNPTVVGRRVFDQVAVDDALDLHDTSIGRDFKGLAPHCSELVEVTVQLAASREHLQNRLRGGGQQCEQPQNRDLVSASCGTTTATTHALEVPAVSCNHVCGHARHRCQ